MLNSTSVPESKALHTVSLPPMTLARSRMPLKPKCPSVPPSTLSLMIFGSMPITKGDHVEMWTSFPGVLNEPEAWVVLPSRVLRPPARHASHQRQG